MKPERLWAGRVVEILEQHTSTAGVLLLLVGWYEASHGQMTQWVAADEVEVMR